MRWRPRENWRALARQRINFARGNARVGIGTRGYMLNLRVHVLVLALLLAGVMQPLLLLLAGLLLGWHVRRHLWPQAVIATHAKPRSTRYRVVALMEFVRLMSIYGFLRGRCDRLYDASFVSSLQRYMGVKSVEELEANGIV